MSLGARGFLISALRPADGALLLFHVTAGHEIRELRHGSRVLGVENWKYTAWCDVAPVDRACIYSKCEEYPITGLEGASPLGSQ